MMFVLELTKSPHSNVKIERGLRSKLNLLHDSDFGIIEKEIKYMADFKGNNKRNNNNGKKNYNNNRNNSNKRPSNKVKDFGSRKDTRISAPAVCGGTIEYKMSKAMADDIIKNDKSKRAPQEVLCEFVNTQFGLMGYCVKVLVN